MFPCRFGQLNGTGGDDLCVRTGDEDGRSHRQGQAIKIPLADDIGHRLTGQAALDICFQLFLHRTGGVQAAVFEKFLLALACGAADELPCFQLRRLHARFPQALTDVQI